MLIDALEPRRLLSVTGQLVTPAPGSVTNADLGYVDVAWVDSTGTGLRANTLDNRDIAISNVTIKAPTQVSPGVWRYGYTGSLAGGMVYVNFVEGQVKNQANESNAFGSASFRYDIVGPNVYQQWPAMTSTYAGDLTRIAIMFTEELDPASFSLSDDVKLLGPDGAVVPDAVKSFNWHTYADSMSIYVQPPNVGGTYSLVVGPNLTDMAGNAMDQDQDGVRGEATQDRFVHNFTVTPLVQFWQENLDTNPGWTIDAGGQWAFGTPTGGGGASYGNPDPTSGHTGSNVYGVNLSGDYRVGLENAYTITSPPIDASGYKHLKLGFWRWLNSDIGNRVDEGVYYSIDNKSWQWIWSNDDNVPTTDGGWQYVEYPLSFTADQQSTLYLRFAHRSQSFSSLPYSGWNVDDITLSGATVSVSAAPGTPDLVPESDTGISDSDNLTNRNNSTSEPAKRLTFRVPGTTPGSVVRIYHSDGRVLGQADATGTETLVTTYGFSFLSEGAHVLKARQAEPGLDFSPPSAGLTITVDSVAPQITVSSRITADLTPAVYGPTPSGGAVQVKATVNGVTYDGQINSAQWFVMDGTIGPLNAGLYDVRAEAMDAAGNVGVDTTLDELKIQPFPPVISAEPGSTAGTSNTVSWQPVDGATHYWVEYDTTNTFASPDGNSGWIAATSTSYTFANLTDGVTYYFRVKAAGFTLGRTGSWSQTTSAEFKTGTLANVNTKTSGSVMLNQGAVLFADDFEDGDDAGWIETQNSYGNYVVTTPAPAPGGGEYELSLWGNAGSYYRPLSSLQPSRVDFNVLAPQIGYVGYFVLEGATDLNRAIFFYMQTDGTMGVFDGTNTMHAVPYQTSQWYKITFLIDWSTKRFSYQVNGQTVATNIPFREDADSFQTLRLYNHFGSFDPKAHYDEISLTSSATPVFQSAGSVTSSLITPQLLSSWSTLNFTKNTPAGTALTVDVLDASGAVLAANVPAGVNLATLGVTAPSIRLRANFSTTNPAVTPSLGDWSLVWKTSPDVYVEGGWSNATSSRQDATAPTMNLQIDNDPMPSSWIWLPIDFNEPVTGVTLADFTLTRDGGPNLLTSAQAVTTLNGQAWKIENVSALTDRAGKYVLTFTPHTIADAAGNVATQGRTFTWLKNRVSGLSGVYGHDTIHIVRDATNASLAHVSHNGDTYTLDLNGFATYGNAPLEVYGHQGDDSITIDFANGSPAPAGGVFVSGGNDEGWLNRFVLRGTAQDDNVEFRNDATLGRHFSVAGAGPGGAAVIVRYDSFYDRRFDGGSGNDSLTMRSDFTFVEDFGTGTVNLTLNVEDGARLLFAESQRLAALHVNNGVAEVNYHGRHTLRTGVLSVASAGTLELQDNDLIVDYDSASTLGTWHAGDGYDGIHGLIASGRIRSTPSLDDGGVTGIAAAEAADVLFLGTGQTGTWQGYSVDSTTVLVKYTYTGDTNLDGLIDAGDYGAIDNWIQFPGTSGYSNGDFNYDGVIDAADYGYIDNNIQVQGAPL